MAKGAGQQLTFLKLFQELWDQLEMMIKAKE
jgi:hypothetical protein